MLRLARKAMYVGLLVRPEDSSKSQQIGVDFEVLDHQNCLVSMVKKEGHLGVPSAQRSGAGGWDAWEHMRTIFLKWGRERIGKNGRGNS